MYGSRDIQKHFYYFPGAFFIQNFVTDFRKKYDEVNSLEENKELENLILLIGAMYQFKVCIFEL
jgi:hypothetical protein